MYREDSKHWSEAERNAIRVFQVNFRPKWIPPQKEFSQWHYLVLSKDDTHRAYHFAKTSHCAYEREMFLAQRIFFWRVYESFQTFTLMGNGKAVAEARGAPRYDLMLDSDFRSAPWFPTKWTETLFDGNGVSPDVTILPEPTYFIGKSDETLDAAIAQIQGER